jgi:hypothetical protein
VWGSADSDCLIFRKYIDHSLKTSLQGGKKQVKMSGEREIFYNVYKFMKTESEVGITIPLLKCRRESLKQHMLVEELYVGYRKKVKMWQLVSQWHFQLHANSEQMFALKVS